MSCRSDLYAPGIEQAGLAADQVIHVEPRDEKMLLAVIEDAVRDGTPCAIIAEARKLPMVASRRLQLVAAEADLPVLMLRHRRKSDRDPLEEPSRPGRAGGLDAPRQDAWPSPAWAGRAGRSSLRASAVANPFP